MNSLDPPSLTLLQTFHEVARTGSVTRAARNLGRSQPAISHRLRALEQDFGVPLFEKVGRGLRLTEFGRRLQAECQDLMARSQRIRERIHHSRSAVAGRVAVGTLPTVAAHLLVPALRGLFETYPDLTLDFRFDYLSRLRGELLAGELDVLVAVGSIETEGLDSVPAGTTSLSAVLAPSLAPARRKRVTPDWLREQRYLAFGGQRDPTFDRIDAYARRERLEGPATPHVPHIETLRELAAAGAGYALLPDYTTRRDREAGRLVALQPAGLERDLPLTVLGRQGQVRSPALEAVRAALAAIEVH